MASWQARLTNLFLRGFIKPSLARDEDLRPARIAAVRRRGVWCAKWLVRPVRGTRVRPVAEDGVRGEWVVAPGAREDRAIFYVHGGAFIIGSPAIYRNLTSRLSRAAGCAVFSLRYRFAPEHPFPAALDDVLAGWRWLTSARLDASRVAAGGDSAGGNLMLAALLRLNAAAAPLPTSAFAMAPWTDLTAGGRSVTDNADADPYIPANLLHPVAAAYLQGADPRAADASPLFGRFAGFPPMLIHVAAGELLLDDAVRLTDIAKAAGVDVTLKVWPGLPHVFQLFAPFVPEGRQSLRELGMFARDHLQRRSPAAPRPVEKTA